MSIPKLVTLLASLQSTILTNIPSANIVYEILPDKNDNTTYPLIEIDVNRISDDNFAASTFTTSNISLTYHSRSEADKFSLAGFTEKIQVNNTLRWIVDAFSLVVLGDAVISNIEAKYLDTLNSGEAGSFDNTTIRVGLSFDLQYKELLSLT